MTSDESKKMHGRIIESIAQRINAAGTDDAALIARLREGALYSCLNKQKLAEQTDRWLAADRIAAQAASIAELERAVVADCPRMCDDFCNEYQTHLVAERAEQELAQARAQHVNELELEMRARFIAEGRAEANAKDAERYRWLREQSGMQIYWLGRREVLDSYIDAAIAIAIANEGQA